jgi:hypothetical protein
MAVLRPPIITGAQESGQTESPPVGAEAPPGLQDAYPALLPIPPGLFLHLLQSRLVVGELVAVCERDPGRDVRVVVADVRVRVVQDVLEFDVHPDPELVDIEGRACSVDPDLLAEATRLLGRELVPWFRHASDKAPVK